MDKTNFASTILKQYSQGKRYFEDLDLYNESFDEQNLEGIIFDRCFLYSSFCRANLRNAKFINGNIKTCDFRDADLTNAHFENLAFESAQFQNAKTEGIYFNNNWSYGQEFNQIDFEKIKNWL